MTSNNDDDQDKAGELAKKNIRLAIILAIMALAIYLGYIFAYY